MPPDTVSPFFDRPIRPLPKRRLRERLSPDLVELIKYPLAPRAKPPLFYHPYNVREENISKSSTKSQLSSEQKGIDEVEKNYVSRRNGEELASEEDEITYKDWIFAQQSADIVTGSYSYSQKPETRYNPQPPGSTASSADGYDSFENTNNKKKRKIPTPGESNLNGVRFSGEIFGTSSPDDLDDLVHHCPSSLQGISGPGRGRYGRIRNGRSPLTTISDVSNNWSNIRTSKQRQPQWSSSPEAAGIISRSIANANAEKISVTPARLQENSKLLQQASKKSSPSAQFTFSCDTKVRGWPGSSNSLSLHQSPLSIRMSNHSTRTSPNLTSDRNTAYPKQIHTAQSYTLNGLKQSQNQAAQSKKNKRRMDKDYLISARQRRHQQGYRNFHHPVSTEDVWICEFCEYERIFGTPPEALIRQYEIKDRRARKREAERRRLLEKAKMKGRKGKKANKTTTKSTLNHDRLSQMQAQNKPNSPVDKDQTHSQSLTCKNDEYFKEYYDDTAQALPNPPSRPHVSSLEVPNSIDTSDSRNQVGSQVHVGNERCVAT
ncbi:hypothetical protein GcM1_236047 [Golovinomyces cichoracearum]|uniref:Uncharacterized protein n=1 Tax=Golovinomyces cichoracearum TaxID=62708 RepID=A0A420IKE9_9PEZI|nr:hypothetical protein GcM1_236047 [Golovinomyces cichoracearum]